MMMRNATKNFRDLSTSNEKNAHLKKSTSSSAKNKANISGFGSSSNTSMTSSLKTSVKKTRIETSKSNKKNIMNTSNSNKSLKQLRETTNCLNKPIQTAKKDNSMKDSKQITSSVKEQKKGTIMVKNIKNKIVGTHMLGNATTTKVIKNNKENTQQFGKKNLNTKISTTICNSMQTQMYPKTPRTPRENSQKLRSETMFNNFNKLNKRETQKNTNEITLSMNMFELGRKLGKGRFGDVYMAREIKTGFALAIKVINKKELKESQMQSQLMQEIKIQLYSNHPNILKMYGFFDDDKKIYLLLELATNGCLFREIRQKTYFTEELACFYFRQVTSGIRYLHSNSVIHRDIKPENILNCFGVLKICDFGWAIYSPIYQRQTFCGTLDYVPPEIVTGEFYDDKADVWCLGVLCYQLCTGKAPFESKTDESETYDKILKVQIDFPIYLSSKVVDFIGRILNREPQKRMNLEEVESHEWMRLHENQSGRMISKEVWDNWMKLAR